MLPQPHSAHTIIKSANRIRRTIPEHVLWAPDVTGLCSSQVLHAIETNAYSCRSVRSAGQLRKFAGLVHAGQQHHGSPSEASRPLLLVRYPIVTADDVGELADLSQHFRVGMVIDHFRHAELASEAARKAGSGIELLIDVDLGFQKTGVRPGPDSVLLAEGLRRLPGLSLRGVFLRTRTLPDDSLLSARIRDALTIGRHCQRFLGCSLASAPIKPPSDADVGQAADLASHIGRNSLPQISAACPELVLDHTRDRPVDTRVAIVLNSLLSDETAVLEQASVRDGATEFRARVISRPSLEWCVIDAGQEDLRDHKSPLIDHPQGATIDGIDREQMTLRLNAGARDLRIGDSVRISLRADQ